jgi:hypothetical protein
MHTDSCINLVCLAYGLFTGEKENEKDEKRKEKKQMFLKVKRTLKLLFQSLLGEANSFVKI